MKCAFCVFLLLFLIQLISAREINCNGKEFVCYDNKRFYQCVQNGPSRIITGDIQNCPEGLICNNEADYECDGEISNEESPNRKTSKLLEVIEEQVENENQIKNSIYNEF